MKLITAIVNGDDSMSVARALSKSGFRATQLSSSGSFLSSDNTTFLICVEDWSVDTVIQLIQEKCHHRKQYVPSEEQSYPVEISVGGATVYVSNIERFEKL